MEWRDAKPTPNTSLQRLLDPIFNDQGGIGRKVTFIVGHKNCAERNRVSGNDPAVSTKLWHWASTTKAGFRRIIDARLGLTLRHHGVTQFATANTKDFQEFGFNRVWNPLADIQ